MSERTVLPAPYPRQMHDHLVRLSDELQFGRGFAADRATWEARRPLVRQALIDAVGGFPERTPLNAQVVGRIDRDGYHIEKVLYESRPGFHVTGALYVPHVDHAVPGVFCPHGHWAEGRYAPDVQRRMVGMARRGYVVLTIDKVGYEDRQGQDHRTRATFLAGVATQGVQLWDNIRGLDYLCARPEVDSSRIGCTGCSGGGNQTMYLSALDERITASAPVCSVEMGECYMHKLFCTCELVPGLRRFADLADICSLIAPRALLLVHGLLDFGFLIDSARKVFLRIQKVYEALGVPERLHHFTSYDTHAYNLEMREAVYAHFDRHLKGLEPPYAPEGEVPIEEFADLRVLPEGLPEGARTMLTIYRELSDPLPPRPAVSDQVAWQDEAERLRRGLADLFSGWPAPTPLRPHSLSCETLTVDGAAATLEKLYIYSEPDVVVPLACYRPAGATGALETVIRFGEDGAASVPDEAIAADLGAGRGVVCLDPRGMGQTRAAQNSDQQAYLSSVTLGRHFAAMRAWDIRRTAEYLLLRDDVARVGLAAHGTLLEGLVALLAAATDGRIARVEIGTLLASYKAQDSFGELTDPGQLAVVPCILNIADIDDLAALVAPRPLCIARLVNGLSEPVGGDLPRAREVYRLLHATGALSLP